MVSREPSVASRERKLKPRLAIIRSTEKRENFMGNLSIAVWTGETRVGGAHCDRSTLRLTLSVALLNVALLIIL